MPRKPLLRQNQSPYLVRIPGAACHCQGAYPISKLGDGRSSVLAVQKRELDWLLLIQLSDGNLDGLMHQLRVASRHRCDHPDRQQGSRARRYRWTVLDCAEALSWAQLYLNSQLSPSLEALVSHAFKRTRISGRALLRLRKESRKVQAHRN